MATAAAKLSTQLLVQFLAAASGCADEASAQQVAAERAAAALEAEVGAVVMGRAVVSAVGFPRGRVPTDALLELVDRSRQHVEVPGVGECLAVVAPLNDEAVGHLVVARSGADGFTADEANLLRGMARSLDMVLVMLRTLDAERRMREHSDAQANENALLLTSLQGRHRLLEQLMGIQRAISRRAPLDHVLDSIVDGAYELLGDDAAALCLLERDDRTRFVHVTSRGFPADVIAERWDERSSPAAVSWLAIAADSVVVAEPGSEFAAGTNPDATMTAAMAAPVHENGVAVGALVVGSLGPPRTYTEDDKATLEAFAEQVSLAITDARTLADMHQAYHDALTGLASRRLFMDRLRQAIVRCARSDAWLGLLFIDLDRFKMVNDTLGHTAGDQLLVEVAERLRACLRAEDAAARFGGDEFAVLLEGIADPHQATLVAERILTSLRQPFLIEGRQFFINGSVGIVTSHSADTDAEALIRDADVAMYDAKQSGSGHYAVFEARMRDRFEQRVELETDLRHALERNELLLNYQPIVDLVSQEIVCIEALVRWRHPTRGLVPPLAFISVAEETGVILELGDWVLKEACRQAARWQRMLAPGTAPAVSVNLSGCQLREPDLARAVASALDESGLDPRALLLEITESVLLNDSRTTIARLRDLKDLGVKLAVDDFGAGYSSLNYLRAFPVDVLKIDKSFVDAIADDPEAANLAQAIVELGRTLRLQTVAEGIETAEQVEVLRNGHCRWGQGYFFSVPLAADDLEELLVREGWQTSLLA